MKDQGSHWSTEINPARPGSALNFTCPQFSNFNDFPVPGSALAHQLLLVNGGTRRRPMVREVRASTVALFFCALPVVCQTSDRSVPIYRITVIQRSIPAINYQYRSLPTKIDFRGTVLQPKAKGEASVESRPGRTEIDAKFENLEEPQRFGGE